MRRERKAGLPPEAAVAEGGGEGDRLSSGPPPGGDGLEEKPFLEHLEDLRWMLLKMLLAWGAATALALGFAPRVLTLVQWPLLRAVEQVGRSGEGDFLLRSLGPADAFVMSLKLSGLAGLVVSLPFLLYFLGRFLLPALKPSEKRYLVPAFTIGGGLFLGGVLFAYRVVLPLALRFFWVYTRRLGIRPEWTITYYTSLVGQLLLAFGLVFEFPVVILLLAKLGVVTYDMLRKIRPYAVVAILIIAGVLTPPDIVSQILMAVPMLLLYEISVHFSRFMQRKGIAGK